MDDQNQAQQPAPRRRVTRRAVITASSVAGLVLGFGGVAAAQTADPAPSPSTSAPSTAEDRECDKEDGTADTTADTPTDTTTDAGEVADDV